MAAKEAEHQQVANAQGRAAHYTGSNMNLLPEIPPPSPLHTPRASASVAACGGQRGRNVFPGALPPACSGAQTRS